jgi:glycosyltransferase involved in cell wall biosynthesis
MAQVTVVIPTRNRGEFLAAALTSVLAQRFGDFEIIVVDDCGTADSTAAVENCRDPRVRLMRHKQQRGGAAARNSGIAASRSPYVAFLDDDDQWYPDKLELQVRLLQSRPAKVGVIYTGYDIVADDKICRQILPAQSGDLSAALLRENLVGGTSSVMVRREFLTATGGFDERLPSFQDYDLWLRLARVCHFDCLQQPLLQYRVHGVKIWTDMDAITRGLELMLEKYGAHAAFRKKTSVYYLSLGVQFCRRGELARGTAALRRAVELDPYHLRAYFYRLAALAAGKNFDRLFAARDRLRAVRRARTA